MKAGLSLQELAVELHRQNEAKADFLVDTRSLRLDAYDSDGSCPLPSPSAITGMKC